MTPPVSPAGRSVGPGRYRLVDEVPVTAAARVYAEGWQSWSPTAWYAAGETSHRPAYAWQHAMRFRPGTPLPPDGVQAEGLLVVDPGDGGPVRTYAAPEPSLEVASLRAVLAGTRLLVSATGEVAVDALAGDPERALAGVGDRFAGRAGVQGLRPAPRVWCSWYRYFLDVTAGDIEENLAALDAHDLPVDVVQVDDGWSHGIGEWTRPTDGFPSMARLVDGIRGTGRQAGIWLAPFLVGADSDLARRRPEWLTGDAGRNWGQDLRGLDLTHPGVREHLSTTLRGLAGLGISYFKLDFLYGGAVPGRRREDLADVAAYRSGLALVRDAVGPDAYLVGCGAPILPSVGLVDAMRVSRDTFHADAADGSRGLPGRRALTARSWQQGRLWVNDPDCLVARPSFALREEWAETIAAYGGLRSCSDRVAELDDWGLRTIRRLLADAPPPEPFPPRPVTPEPGTPEPFTRARPDPAPLERR